MGLLEHFNPEIAGNSFYQGFDENRGALGGLSAALSTGTMKGFTNSLANNLQAGSARDTLRADKRATADQEDLAKQRTIEFLTERGAADLIVPLQAGMLDPRGAYNAWEARELAANAPPPERRIMQDVNDINRYVDTGEQVFQGVTATPEIPSTPPPTSGQREYELAKSQGFAGSFMEYKLALAHANSGAYNKSQGEAAGFADRASEANRTISAPEMTDAMLSAGQQALGVGGVVTNWLRSPEAQQAEQAQRNFVNAVLRQESGAVIADSEFENAAKQYFPQVGDSEAVIAQKASNRQAVIDNLARSAGPDYALPQLIQGQPMTTQTGVQWSVE